MKSSARMCNMTSSNQRTLSPLSPNNKLFGLASVHDFESSQLKTLPIFNELLTKP